MGTSSEATTKAPAFGGEDFARTMSYGERAFMLLKQLRAPAVPRNYELFYAFTAAANKELCQDLRKALETDSCLTDEAAERIYRTHLSKPHESNEVEEVGTRINDELTDIMSVIEAAGERAGSYGQSLEGITVKLAQIESPQQLKTMLGELFENTKDMSEYNRVLEKRLAESKSQIDDLHMKLELTRLESFIDELTGLTNRKRFDQTMELEIVQAQETGDPLSVMMIDIDHFKTFNDSYGHQTGDQVLRLVGHTLKTNVKGRDCAARYGGEEFAIILPRTKLASAITLGEQIRVAVKTKELVKKSSKESLGHVTLSIGVATYQSGETAASFVARADSCLYAAKQAGRDNVKAETDLRDFETQTTAA